uniref:Uncharacterized protein n=1 Tax=Cuerna arida TaxID=1464854 RepID=A0A1B6EHM6_9HEMI
MFSYTTSPSQHIDVRMEEESPQVPCITIEDDDNVEDNVEDDIIVLEVKNVESSSKTNNSTMPQPKKNNYELEMDLIKTLISSGEDVPVKYKTFFEMSKNWKPQLDPTIILAAWKRILGIQTKHMMTEGTLFSASIPDDTDSQDSVSTIVLDTDSISESEDTETDIKFTDPAMNNSQQNISIDLDSETSEEVQVEHGNFDHLAIHATQPEDKALHELNSKVNKERLSSKSSVDSQAVLAGSKKEVVQLNQTEKKSKRKRKSDANDAKGKKKSGKNKAKKKRKSDTNNDDYYEHKKLYWSTDEYKNFLIKQKKLIYEEKKKLALKQVEKLHNRMVDLLIPKYFNRNLNFD